MHVGIANPKWRGKRSWHSQRMRSPQIYVSGKRPMVIALQFPKYQPHGRSLRSISSSCIMLVVRNIFGGVHFGSGHYLEFPFTWPPVSHVSVMIGSNMILEVMWAVQDGGWNWKPVHNPHIPLKKYSGVWQNGSPYLKDIATSTITFHGFILDLTQMFCTLWPTWTGYGK